VVRETRAKAERSHANQSAKWLEGLKLEARRQAVTPKEGKQAGADPAGLVIPVSLAVLRALRRPEGIDLTAPRPDEANVTFHSLIFRPSRIGHRFFLLIGISGWSSMFNKKSPR
jgi:hypothetical protein